jgi:hypothetical protein
MAQGCYRCSSASAVQPGTLLSDIYTPKVQVTLGPGTYTVTNAAATGQYSAWNFEGIGGALTGNTENWGWAFAAADDATGIVLLDHYVATGSLTPKIFATQDDAAAVTGILTYDCTTLLPGTSTASFIDTFTPPSTTTIDFFADDYYLPDNAGGMELDIGR